MQPRLIDGLIVFLRKLLTPLREDCTKLLDLPDSLLVCLVEAVSLRDPSSFKHGIVCRKFRDISSQGQSAVEISTWPGSGQVSPALKEFANLSNLSVQSLPCASHLEELLKAAPAWSRLKSFKATLEVPEAHSLRSEPLTSLFEGCKELRTLELVGLVGVVPPSITSLVHLQELVLEEDWLLWQRSSGGVGSDLLSLPDNLGDLTGLRSLKLRTSQDSLPSMHGLRRLKSLCLECSDLEELPDSITALTELRELRLNRCHELASLPEHLSLYSSLRKLDIRGCVSLRVLPIPFSPSSRLRELHTWTAADLQRLPDLPRLSFLNIESNGGDLPQEIGRLQQISGLELYGLSSFDLPATMGELRHLKSLKLERLLFLKCLPEQLSGLTALTELHISYCSQLKHVDPVCGLCSLECLHISFCKRLQSLPHDLLQCCPALHDLELEQLRAVRKLPRGIHKCKRLTRLVLGLNCR